MYIDREIGHKQHFYFHFRLFLLASWSRLTRFGFDSTFDLTGIPDLDVMQFAKLIVPSHAWQLVGFDRTLAILVNGVSGVVSFRWPVSTTALQRVVGENGFFLLILACDRFYCVQHPITRVQLTGRLAKTPTDSGTNVLITFFAYFWGFDW